MQTAFLSDTRTGKPPLPNLKKRNVFLGRRKGKLLKEKNWKVELQKTKYELDYFKDWGRQSKYGDDTKM